MAANIFKIGDMIRFSHQMEEIRFRRSGYIKTTQPSLRRTPSGPAAAVRLREVFTL